MVTTGLRSRKWRVKRNDRSAWLKQVLVVPTRIQWLRWPREKKVSKLFCVIWTDNTRRVHRNLNITKKSRGEILKGKVKIKEKIKENQVAYLPWNALCAEGIFNECLDLTDRTRYGWRHPKIVAQCRTVNCTLTIQRLGFRDWDVKLLCYCKM